MKDALTPPARVIFIIGEIGVGKTLLARGLCTAMSKGGHRVKLLDDLPMRLPRQRRESLDAIVRAAEINDVVIVTASVAAIRLQFRRLATQVIRITSEVLS